MNKMSIINLWRKIKIKVINPWSLERLLHTSHQGEAISGTIDGRNDQYKVQLKTSRRPEQGDFTYINAEIEMRRAKEKMFSAEQVYDLTSLYGGNESLRAMLVNDFDKFPDEFFDICIDKGEIRQHENFRTLRMPHGEFSPRPLLRDLCMMLNLCHEEKEDGFYLHEKQSQATLSSATIGDVYHRMKMSGYFPSLSCSSSRTGFSLYQFPELDGVHQTLSIYLGELCSRENPLKTKEISRLQKTLLEYCPELPILNYTWKTETAKDLEREWGE